MKETRIITHDEMHYDVETLFISDEDLIWAVTECHQRPIGEKQMDIEERHIQKVRNRATAKTVFNSDERALILNALVSFKVLAILHNDEFLVNLANRAIESFTEEVTK